MIQVFGFLAVAAMVVTYALEKRSPWFVLAFSGACAAAAAYAALIRSWPFALVEAVWAVVALIRWNEARRERHAAGPFPATDRPAARDPR